MEKSVLIILKEESQKKIMIPYIKIILLNMEIFFSQLLEQLEEPQFLEIKNI